MKEHRLEHNVVSSKQISPNCWDPARYLNRCIDCTIFEKEGKRCHDAIVTKTQEKMLNKIRWLKKKRKKIESKLKYLKESL